MRFQGFLEFGNSISSQKAGVGAEAYGLAGAQIDELGWWREKYDDHPRHGIELGYRRLSNWAFASRQVVDFLHNPRNRNQFLSIPFSGSRATYTAVFSTTDFHLDIHACATFN
jgi:hypothetical protein